MDPVVKTVGAKELRSQDGIAKLSVVGIGMRSHSGVAAKLFQALSDAQINVQMISTSEIKISVTVDEKNGPQAVQAVHQAFGLEK
jgi:aspartate kinase